MQNFPDIVVRRAALSDAAAIATYLWQTDAYIYPSAVDSPNDPAWVDFIARSLADADSIYSRDRILVAQVQGKVVGVCAFFRCGEKLRFALPINTRIREGLDYIDLGYFRPLIAEYSQKGRVYVPNLCVDENYRGGGIGGTLLEGLFALFPDYDIVLDVVEDNLPARGLYEKKGFIVTKRYLGFGGKMNATVPCLEMIRPLKNEN